MSADNMVRCPECKHAHPPNPRVDEAYVRSECPMCNTVHDAPLVNSHGVNGGNFQRCNECLGILFTVTDGVVNCAVCQRVVGSEPAPEVDDVADS